jgi:prephenate dehydrogenase
MTRIAAGSPDMWTGIVMSNREEIRRGLEALIEELETLRREVANGSAAELRALLGRAREVRGGIHHRS